MKTIFLLLLVIAAANFAEAQTITAGFRAESYLIQMYGSEPDIVPFFSYYGTLGMDINPKFTAELRIGYMVGTGDYSGFETGIFAKYFLLRRLIYLSGGYQLHFNNGGGHGTVNSATQTVQFLSFGAGVQDRYVFFDIMGYLPVQSAYGSYVATFPDYHFETMKVDYLIKASIGCEIPLSKDKQ